MFIFTPAKIQKETMIANFLRKSKPANILVILMISLCFYVLGVFTKKIQFNTWIFLLIPVLFGLMNFINIKNKLTFDNLYAFFIYILLLFLFPKTLVINKTFLANLILLICIRRIYSFQSSNAIFKKLFDAGFWLGISFIIEPFTGIFILFLYISVYLYQQITTRTAFIPIIGFSVPIFLYFTYFFWYDKTTEFKKLFNWFTDYDLSIYQSSTYLFSIALVVFFVVIVIVLKTPKVLSVKGVFQLSWKLVIFNFIISLALIILTENKNGTELLYILFPAAIIIANGIEIYQKKWISDIVILLFFISSVAVYLKFPFPFLF